MKHVNSFKELEVYKTSRQLSREIALLCKTFPADEKYSLCDQIKRSSRSIGAQIAECWGKRRYEKHFVSKLSDADSEQFETQHWIEVALESCYLNDNDANKLLNYCETIGRMLQSMIDKSHLFCHKTD